MVTKQVLLVFLLFIASSLSQTPPKLPNIEYITYGYNIFYGNPHASTGDPGFILIPLFDLNFSQGLVTNDNKWSIPDSTSSAAVLACMVLGSTETISSAYAYQSSLQIDASTKDSYLKASFSASTDFQLVQKSTSTNSAVFVTTSATCETYQVYTSQIFHPDLSVNFINQAIKLPITFNAQNATAFWNFFDLIGTHFVTQLKLGSRWGYMFQSSLSQWSTLNKMGINIAVAAGYAGLVNAQVSLNTSYERQMAANFTQYTENTEMYSLGVPPPSTASSNEWLNLSLDSVEMSPLQYSLANITSLFTSDYTSNAAVLARYQAVSAALEQYCTSHLIPVGALVTCDAPPIPPPPPPPVGWAALACKPNNCWSWMGLITNGQSQNQAESYALDGCTACQVQYSTSDGCLAVALTPSGGWGWAFNTTLKDAMNNAITSCKSRGGGSSCALAAYGCATPVPANSTWGAIACDSGCSHIQATSRGFLDRGEARNNAEQGLQDPFIAIDFTNCGALAQGKYGHWGAAAGDTLQDTMNDAMTQCQLVTQDCQVVSKFCTDASYNNYGGYSLFPETSKLGVCD